MQIQGRRRVEAKGCAVTVVVITDGMENASKEFTRESVYALIKEKQADGWTFVFISAEIDSYAVGGSMGMSVGNISNYDKGLEAQLYSATANATRRRPADNREHGVQSASERAFFDEAEKAAMGDLGLPIGVSEGDRKTSAIATRRDQSVSKRIVDRRFLTVVMSAPSGRPAPMLCGWMMHRTRGFSALPSKLKRLARHG